MIKVKYFFKQILVLEFFEEAGKIWPKEFNLSEEIALILLNKLDYCIPNTLLALREPTQEVIILMKGKSL